jgi:sigma-E factor negative regulatory protein RseB
VSAAPQVPADWLKRMQEAAVALDYRGTFVQLQNGEVETIRVVHGSDRERLLLLTGAAREIVREHETVKCIHPRDARGEVDLRQVAVRFNVRIGEVPGDLETHYRFIDLGEARVAGRESRVIGLRPKDDYRYGRRYWIDLETFMALRSELVGEEGESLQQVMFTEFEPVSEFSEGEFTPVLDRDAERYVTRRARFDRDSGKDDGLAKAEWRFEGLPEGFELRSLRLRPKRRGEPVHHLVFSDGLASVSLFVEMASAPAGDKLAGSSRMGAVNAYGVTRGELHLTAVGEVPPATVRRIVEALVGAPDNISSGTGGARD